MARLIGCEALEALLDRGETCALLDVREQGEYSAGQIWLATSLPRREIEFRLPDLVPVRQTPVVVYDDGDGRADLAVTTMARRGITMSACSREAVRAGWRPGTPRSRE